MMTKALNTDSSLVNDIMEDNAIRALKPGLKNYVSLYIFFGLSLFFSFRVYGLESHVGFYLLIFASSLLAYTFLAIFTTTYLIGQEGVFIIKGLFSKKQRNIPYNDINRIKIHQGLIQKRLRTGNLEIYTDQITYVLKGISYPHRTKELINREKDSYNERRSLLKNIL